MLSTFPHSLALSLDVDVRFEQRPGVLSIFIYCIVSDQMV